MPGWWEFLILGRGLEKRGPDALPHTNFRRGWGEGEFCVGGEIRTEQRKSDFT